MAGRASVWSDARVAELARRTVACADEVWRLQRGDDAESLRFRRMADQGHYGGGAGTRQGIYLATPGGRLLASVNSLDAGAVAEMLERGLAAWDALTDEERRAGAEVGAEPAHRWEWSRPRDGLVLRSAVRDLPRDLDPAGPHVPRWNRDHAWFTRDEARGWLPDAPRAGEVHDVPWRLVARLARFHLVDNAGGQTLPFAEPEVAGSHARSTVTAVDGARVAIEIEGLTRAVADGEWRLGDNDWKPDRPWPRGVLARLLGRGLYDLDAQAFVTFELQAHGVRWGRTEVNGRHDDPGPAPIGVHFTLAGDAPDAAIAPAFIDVYDGDWVVRPGDG